MGQPVVAGIGQLGRMAQGEGALPLFLCLLFCLLLFLIFFSILFLVSFTFSFIKIITSAQICIYHQTTVRLILNP